MAVTATDKAKVIADNQRGKGDTGSPEVQIALLTARINGLTDHFKSQRQGPPFAPRSAAHGHRGGASFSTISSRATSTFTAR